MIDDQVYRNGKRKSAKRQNGATTPDGYEIGTPATWLPGDAPGDVDGPVSLSFDRQLYEVTLRAPGARRVMLRRELHGPRWLALFAGERRRGHVISRAAAAAIVGWPYVQAAHALLEAAEDAADRRGVGVTRAERHATLWRWRATRETLHVPPCLWDVSGARPSEEEPRPCVYFLVRDGVVVYVGQSRSLQSRIGSHRTEKRFDSVWFVPVDEASVDRVEAAYIKKFAPEYNISPGRGGLPKGGRR